MTFKVQFILQFIIFVISSINHTHMDIQIIQRLIVMLLLLVHGGQREGLDSKPLTLNRAGLG